MTKNYIEFRVYFDDSGRPQEVFEAAEQLKDFICDSLNDDSAPKCFTQDVTYEIIRGAYAQGGGRRT